MDRRVLSQAVYTNGEMTTPRYEWWLVAQDDGKEIWMPVGLREWDDDGALDCNTIVEAPKWMPLPGSQALFLHCPVQEVLLHGNRGPGKAVLNTATILTDSGWKQVGDVTRADRLVSVDGTYTDIVGIYPQADGPLYRVTFDDDSFVDVDGAHRWLVLRGKNGDREGWIVRATDQIRQYKEDIYIPTMSSPAPGYSWSGPDPYVCGLILGDGTLGSDRVAVYSSDEGINEYLNAQGWKTYRYEYSTCWMNSLPGSTDGSNPYRSLLGRCKGDKKSVPESLRMADPEARLAVLQGLMDSGGSVDAQGRCRFVSVSEQLAKDVQYLVRSLGGKARHYKEDRVSPKGGRDYRWRVNVIHCNKFNPFRLPRKVERVKPMKGVHRKIVSIEPAGRGAATCFEVAHPSHLFVVQEFIVTHNTEALLMSFASQVGKGFGSAWRGILFRKTFGDLEDVEKKLNSLYPRMFDGFRFNKSKSDYSANFKDGEKLLLRNLESEDDYGEYHGHEYPWLGFEELTQWETDGPYLLMHSCSRSSTPGMPLMIRATTNPSGPGHRWVKKRWNLPHGTNKVITEMIEGVAMRRVSIKSHLDENFILLTNTPHYKATIRKAAKTPALAAAWLEGSWDITSGGLIDDLWSAPHHVIPNLDTMRIPRGWTINRSYDHGQSHPFAVLWWAESNGEPMRLKNGQMVGNVRGDLILIAEWYGRGKEDNTGVRMSSVNIAKGIKEREDDLGISHRCTIGPADTEIWSKDSRGTQRAPKDDMEDEGVFWDKADKTPGSRKRGWEKLRDYLEGAIPNEDGTRERPGIFICERNRHWLDLVPPMPSDRDDPDELPEGYEDHICDATRYRLLLSPQKGWKRTF